MRSQRSTVCDERYPARDERSAVVAARNGIPWGCSHRHGGPYDGHRLQSADPGGAVSAVLAPERAVGCVVHATTEPAGPGVVGHPEGGPAAAARGSFGMFSCARPPTR